jgi:hypothetical protein
MIKERVIEIADYKGITKEKFFEILGMTSANFRGSARNTPLNSNAIENILSKFPEISPDWLLTGSGPMLRPEPKNLTQETEPTPDKYEKLEKDIKKLTHDLSKKCIDLTTTLAEQQTRLTEIISSQQRIIEELTKKD